MRLSFIFNLSITTIIVQLGKELATRPDNIHSVVLVENLYPLKKIVYIKTCGNNHHQRKLGLYTRTERSEFGEKKDLEARWPRWLIAFQDFFSMFLSAWIYVCMCVCMPRVRCLVLCAVDRTMSVQDKRKYNPGQK